MHNQDEVQSIGVTLEELKAKITLRDRLGRLEVNRDFKALVLEGYFKEKAIDLSRVASQVTLNEKSKQVWDNAQIGISAFQAHLHAIYQEAASAEEALAEYQADLAAE